MVSSCSLNASQIIYKGTVSNSRTLHIRQCVCFIFQTASDTSTIYFVRLCVIVYEAIRCPTCFPCFWSASNVLCKCRNHSQTGGDGRHEMWQVLYQIQTWNILIWCYVNGKWTEFIQHLARFLEHSKMLLQHECISGSVSCQWRLHIPPEPWGTGPVRLEQHHINTVYLSYRKI